MAETVLIAYASRYGSTKEVAEKVGERLRERGVEAQVKPVESVASIDSYHAIVLGAPLYYGSLHKEAGSFLQAHEEVLSTKPFAVFVLGPLAAGEGIDDAYVQLEESLEKTPSIKPVVQHAFVGKYDPAHLKFADKLTARLPASPLHGVEAHDDRNWDEIVRWADTLPQVLGVREATAVGAPGASGV